MDLEDVPDEVWGYVEKLELVYDAIRHSDDSSWRELVEEARGRWRESLEGTGSVLPPGRGEGEGARGPSTEILVEPSEYSLKRARAFSEMAAALAEKHPEIKSFRRMHLRNGLLTADGARTFLDRHDGPDGSSGIMMRAITVSGKPSSSSPIVSINRTSGRPFHCPSRHPIRRTVMI